MEFFPDPRPDQWTCNVRTLQWLATARIVISCQYVTALLMAGLGAPRLTHFPTDPPTVSVWQNDIGQTHDTLAT